MCIPLKNLINKNTEKIKKMYIRYKNYLVSQSAKENNAYYFYKLNNLSTAGKGEGGGGGWNHFSL